MPPFEFQSPGANAYQAIQNYLMQREEEKRQAMLAQLAQQKQQEDIQMRRDDLALRRQAEARQASELALTRGELSNEREFRRGSTLVENAIEGDPTDEATRAMLTRQGFGGAVMHVPGILQQGALLSTDEQDIPTYDVTQSPDSYQMRGGYKWRALQDTQQARTDAAQAAALAATERQREREEAATARATEANENRALIAGITSAGAAESRGLRNDILRADLQKREAEAKATAATRTREADASRDITDQAWQLATRLENHEGLNSTYGVYDIRSGRTPASATFKGIRDQLVNALALPNLGVLKGPMSDKDILFVKNISTRLGNDNIDDAEALLAIQEAKRFLAAKLTGAIKTFPNGTRAIFNGIGWIPYTGE